MNLVATIAQHARGLPPHLQQEVLDFITWIERRHGLSADALPRHSGGRPPLEALIGCLGEDFPDDVTALADGDDLPREPLP